MGGEELEDALLVGRARHAVEILMRRLGQDPQVAGAGCRFEQPPRLRERRVRIAPSARTGMSQPQFPALALGTADDRPLRYGAQFRRKNP